MANIADEINEYLTKNFDGLDLSKKIISSKIFDGCIFNKCDFSEATLNDNKFIDCHFVKCNFSIVNIQSSHFLDVIFDECKVIGTDWTDACWPGIPLCAPIKFHKCIINDSSFFGLSLEEMVIEECKAHDVDFREGNFSEANFTYTDFTGSLFNKTNLTGADFTEATNYNIDIYFNEIKRAKFCRHEAVRLLESLDIELID